MCQDRRNAPFQRARSFFHGRHLGYKERGSMGEGSSYGLRFRILVSFGVAPGLFRAISSLVL